MSDMHNTHGGSDLPPENLAGDRTTYLPAGHALPGAHPTPSAGTGLGAARVDDTHLLPERAGPGEPGQIAAIDDPDVARAEIEATRARMSETIDSIENALLRKKGELQERMDVTAPVRQRVREQPLLVAGGVFAAGLLLGYLTGGKDDETEDLDVREILQAIAAGNAANAQPSAGVHHEDAEWRARARDWERQARRLMRENRQYEEELRSLRAQLGEPGPGEATYVAEVEDLEGDESRGGWRDAVSGALAGLFRRRVNRDVEVEFHPDAALEEELDDGWGGYRGSQAGLGDGSPGLQGYGSDRGYDGYDNDRYPNNQLPA